MNEIDLLQLTFLDVNMTEKELPYIRLSCEAIILVNGIKIKYSGAIFFKEVIEEEV